MWTEQPAKSVEQLEQRVRELQDEKRLLMEEDAQLKARIRQINASNESLRQGIRTLSMKNAKNALDVELARQGM
jgi:prefoldin subunit 5